MSKSGFASEQVVRKLHEGDVVVSKRETVAKGSGQSRPWSRCAQE